MMPTLGNNLVWRSLYLHAGRIHTDRIRVGWFGGAAWKEGTSLPLVTARELTPAELARNADTRAFERFAWFSDEWLARSPGDESVIGDMRYSMSTEAFDPIWGIRFTAPPAPNAIEWVSRSRDRRIAVSELWAEVVGRHPGYRNVADAKASAGPTMEAGQ